MGNMNNIYVLNFITEKRLGAKGNFMALFVDFKALLPSVNKGILWEVLKE